MNKRSASIARLEELGPALRRRFEGSRGHDALLERFGGATLHQLSALRHLVKDGPLTMNELATRMSITPSSATQLADRLVQHGFVDRTPDTNDRRVLRLSIATSAAAAVREFETDRRRQFADLLTPLSEADLDVLVGFAERIAQPDDPDQR